MSDLSLSFLNNQISGVTDNIDMSKFTEANGKALLDLLNNLSNGDTLAGKLISFNVNDNTYTFETENHLLLNAKAEGGVSLPQGSTVLFEVRKSFDSKISLRPLNTNVNTENTAVSALKQSNIPINERSLEMTLRNMEYGNPIDKEALSQSYREVYVNSDIPVKVIVDLQKLGIERTDSNIRQYMDYLNMENSITESFSDISNTLSKEISDSVLNSILNNEAITGESALLNLSDAALEKTVARSLIELVSTSDSADINNSSVVYNKANFEASSNELVSLIDSLFESPLSEASDELINLNGEKVENSEGILDANSSGALPKEFNDKLQAAVKAVIDKAIQKKFVVDLESDAPKKESIKKLYEDLYSVSKKLVSMLEEGVSKDRGQTQTLLNKLSSNIDFMNSLNDFIPYIQIPFNGDNGLKAGELYVYRNKKGLANKDSELSAFLHLDTDHLGPTDVYVTLRDMKVSTHFTLSNEENLLFIEKNLHYLTKRLNEKGYDISANVTLKEEGKSPIEEALDRSVNKILIAETSFDARV